MQAEGLPLSGEGMEKEHKTELCPSKDKEIKMGIFLLGTRQDYTKLELGRRV